jgi:hypothetical protein
MKMRTCWVLLALAAIPLLRPVIASEEVSFSAGLQINAASDFYDPLTPYGAWVQVGSYGRCWHPTVSVGAGWRPYATGHWQWTDCGWYWVSDEPWAWACYHYGYWVMDPNYGWVWAPGTEWAPAWVAWRESPDYAYIGWAPCGPGGVALSASWFCFVDAHHFHDPILPGALIVNDPRLVERTRVVSGVRHETRNFDGRSERVVVNNGPRVDALQKVTGQTFTPTPVREAVRSAPLPQPVLQRAEPWRREGARVVEQSGREQTRINQRPPTAAPSQPSVKTAQPSPNGRQQTPSGREQPQVKQQPSTAQPMTPSRPTPPETRSREQVTAERPSTPPSSERPLPPTGRQEPKHEEPRTAAPPPRAEPARPAQPEHSQTPARPAERPPEPERGHDKDKDHL